jgi:hypothetical protein
VRLEWSADGYKQSYFFPQEQKGALAASAAFFILLGDPDR